MSGQILTSQRRERLTAWVSPEQWHLCEVPAALTVRSSFPSTSATPGESSSVLQLYGAGFSAAPTRFSHLSDRLFWFFLLFQKLSLPHLAAEVEPIRKQEEPEARKQHLVRRDKSRVEH